MHLFSLFFIDRLSKINTLFFLFSLYFQKVSISEYFSIKKSIVVEIKENRQIVN